MAASQATLVPVGVDVPPDDEAPADADADGGLADRIWTTRQCRDYTFFRWYVRTSLEEHQHGIKREEFLRLPGLAGNRSKKKRRALGFRTSQQLLDSMSDIVKTLHSTDPGTSFKYYPANAPPETGGALGPVEQPAAKDNVVAVPYMVPFWAIMRLQPKRGETQGKRVVHPEYLLLRDAVQLSIRYFPKGTDLWTFARKTGLGTPQAKRVRKRLGCGKLSDFLASMPDLITLRLESDAESKRFFVYPPHSPFIPAEEPEHDPEPGPGPEPEPDPGAADRPSHMAKFQAPTGEKYVFPEDAVPVEEADFSDVELPDLGYFPIEAYFWTKKQKYDYTCFRTHIENVFKRYYPDGGNAQHFVSHRGLIGKKARRRRLNLGYPTIWEFLRSMPDLLTLVDEGPIHEWMVYPHWVSVQRPDKRAQVQEPVPFPAPMDVPDPAPGKKNKGHIKTVDLGDCWGTYRALVQLTARRYPGGTDLQTFCAESGLLEFRWLRAHKRPLMRLVLQHFSMMEDLVRFERSEAALGKSMVYPARPDLPRVPPSALKQKDMGQLREYMKLQIATTMSPGYVAFTEKVQDLASASYPEGPLVPPKQDPTSPFGDMFTVSTTLSRRSPSAIPGPPKPSTTPSPAPPPLDTGVTPSAAPTAARPPPPPPALSAHAPAPSEGLGGRHSGAVHPHGRCTCPCHGGPGPRLPAPHRSAPLRPEATLARHAGAGCVVS